MFPEGFWAYLAQRPEAGCVFSAAMGVKAHGAVAGILASYDFSGVGRNGDIGGGNGHLLRAVLDAVPTARGVLFELRASRNTDPREHRYEKDRYSRSRGRRRAGNW